MYTIKKEGRTLRGKKFETYEAGRQYARKLIRAKGYTDDLKRATGWDSISRNPPSLADYDFQIVRVAGASAKASAVGLTD